ncbi:MAG: aquaporin [Bacteroidota bacterium]|nr:aquaporin [Bacteroidota bacterium]
MKNYITEFIGTFFLVLAIGFSGDPFIIGVMLMVMVYMGGHISGAHYNPAVSIAMIIRGMLTKVEAIRYILAQLLGAFFAVIFNYWVTGNIMEVNPSEIAPLLHVLVIEILFTFILVLVILNVATNSKTEGNSYYGIAIGSTVMVGAYIGGPISGGAYNPAVGIGPIFVDIIFGNGFSLSNMMLYFLAPIIGGVLAAFLYRKLN